MNALMESVHPTRVTGLSGEQLRATGTATAHRSEGIVEQQSPLGQSIQIGCLAEFVQIGARLEASIISQE